MFRNLLKNRLFMAGFVFFLFSVVGGSLYLWHIERQTTENMERDATRTKASSTAGENQGPRTETPIVQETSPEGHVHADGTWHEGEHTVGESTPQTGIKPPVPTVGDVDSPLTEREIRSLYSQLAKEIEAMRPEDLHKGPDLSQYSEKQRNYLLKRGLNLALFPKNVQDKLSAHEWEKIGMEPPPPGYTYLQNEDGTYFLHKAGEPHIVVHTDADGKVTGSTFSFSGSLDGRDLDHLTNSVIQKAAEKVEAERAKAPPEPQSP